MKGDEIILLTGETLPYIICKSENQPKRYAGVLPCILTDAMAAKRTVKRTSEVTKHLPLQELSWWRLDMEIARTLIVIVGSILT